MALLIRAYPSSTPFNQAAIRRDKMESEKTVEGAVQVSTESYGKIEVQLFDKKIELHFFPKLG